MTATPLAATREQLRTAISSLTAGNRRRYPPALRARIARYAQLRLDGGDTRASVCADLGVSDPTLTRILDEARPRLVPVDVVRPVTSAPEAQQRALVLRTPSGIVVEGLDVTGVAALLRALA